MRISNYALGVCVAAILFAAPGFAQDQTQGQAPQQETRIQVNPNEVDKCVIGCEGMKTNAGGKINIVPEGLEFIVGKKKLLIKTASITDIFTGQESRQDVTGMTGTAVKAAIPYGGGRFISLFSHKVEVLTVEYNDDSGGFHGVIWVLDVGKATEFRNKLVAQGAKVQEHVEAPAPPKDETTPKEQK